MVEIASSNQHRPQYVDSRLGDCGSRWTVTRLKRDSLCCMHCQQELVFISSPSSSEKQQGGHSAWIKDVHESHAVISGLVFHRSEGNGRLLGSKSPGFWRPVVVDMINDFQLMRLAGSHKVTYHWHSNDMVSVCKRAALRLDASGL